MPIARPQRLLEVLRTSRSRRGRANSMSTVTARSPRAHYSRCEYFRSTRVPRPSREQPAVNTRTQREQHAQQNPATPSAPPESLPQGARENGEAGASQQRGSTITCPFCDLVMELSFLDTHLYMCENAFVPCPNGCEAVVRPPDMEEHLTTCPQNLSTCPACGMVGSAVDVQNHLNVCRQVILRCRRCGGEFLRGETEQHRRTCGRVEHRPDRTRTNHRRVGDTDSAPLGHHSRYEHFRSTRVPRPSREQPAVHTRTQREQHVQQNPATPSAPPESLPQGARENGEATASQRRGNTIRCPFCDLSMERSHLDTHLYVCENAFVPCPNGCEAVVRPPDMEEHLTTCPQNISRCPACGMVGSAVDVQNHVNTCPQVILRCRRCGGEFLRVETEQHRRTCGRAEHRPDTRRARTDRRRRDADSTTRLLACPNGCEAVVRPQDMEEHLTTCPQNLSTCPACGMVGSAVDVQNHLNVCPQVIVSCRHCGREFPRGESEQHRRRCGLAEHRPDRTRTNRRRGHTDSEPLIEREDDSLFAECCSGGLPTWAKILVGMLVFLVLPTLFFAEVAVGARYANECPFDQRIPVYLVISGVAGILSILITIAIFAVSDETLKKRLGALAGLLYLFMFAWFIAGSVFVYSAYPVSHFSTVPTDPSYCDTTVYLFAFGILTAVYGLLGLALIVLAIFCVLACYFEW